MTILLFISCIAALLLALGMWGDALLTRNELETTRQERDTLARLAASQTLQRLKASMERDVLARSLTHSLEGNQQDALAILSEFTTAPTEEIA